MKNLEKYRTKVGLSIKEVAERIGLSIDWYRDLESYPDEIFTTISLAHLELLGKILNVEPLKLLRGENCLIPDKQISFAELSASLNNMMKEKRLTAKEFSEIVGWELKDILIDPQEIWNMNVDGLVDICKAAEMDWLAVLPGLPEKSIEKACL
jgi:transcriptional regulator with XRE-family HTH domain